MRSLKFVVVRFFPLALLTPLSALCVGSIAQANHISPSAVEVFDAVEAHLHHKNIARIDGQLIADASSAIIVTEDNFPQAYTNLRFDNIIKKILEVLISFWKCQWLLVTRQSNLLFV